MSTVDVKDAVREKYAQAALRVGATGASCCGASSARDPGNPITSKLYDSAETETVPEGAVLASLGCGNPTALAQLNPGETVLDLGSGGGIDVLLSARRVAPTGKAYGLDMTDEMLALARENQRKAGVENVEFLKGEIENIPLLDNSVDVIISNCVINLSRDKDRVLSEAFRVLKPGGRLAIADIVLRRALSGSTSELIGLWTGCVAGALVVADYESKLRAAGFEDVSIEPTRVFGRGDIDALAAELSVDTGTFQGVDRNEVMTEVTASVISASIRGRKPE